MNWPLFTFAVSFSYNLICFLSILYILHTRPHMSMHERGLSDSFFFIISSIIKVYLLWALTSTFISYFICACSIKLLVEVSTTVIWHWFMWLFNSFRCSFRLQTLWGQKQHLYLLITTSLVPRTKYPLNEHEIC